MKKSKTNFLDWNNKILISSIRKINFNIILIIILDLLFYFMSGFLFIAWLQRIQAKMYSFNIPKDIVSVGYDRAQQLIGETRMFYFLMLGSFILVLIAIIFLASITKGIIWAKTTSTKISMKLISRFFGLNLIWMGFWFVPVILISFLIEPSSAPMFMIIAIILGFYFTNSLYTIFMKEQKLKSIIESIKLSVAKIHMFLIPYTAVFLLLFIITRLGSLLKFSYSAFIMTFVLVLFAAFVRYYISELVMEVQKL